MTHGGAWVCTHPLLATPLPRCCSAVLTVPVGSGRAVRMEAHLFEVLAGVHVCQIEKAAGALPVLWLVGLPAVAEAVFA